MSNGISAQHQLASVQQFNCTNCGSALEVLNPRAKYVSCQYCGSVLDSTSEEHEILQALNPPDEHPPFSFIRLGQIAIFDGIPHQVIARTRWLMTYKEYWSEEGEAGYSNENWTFDEWLLMNENYTYFYLVEDIKGYWRSEEIIPETPMLLPDNLRMKFYENQRYSVVREYGEARSIHFEGESNYQIKVGDLVRFSMFKERGMNYSAEWRLNDAGEVAEVEFFREQRISRRKMLEAFDGNETVKAIREKERDWKFVFRVAQYTFFALLLLFVISMVYDGNTIFTQAFDVNQLTSGPTTGGGTLVSDPIEIPGKGLYCLELLVDGMENNSEMDMGVYILGEDSAAINTLVPSFYYYTGYDSDGKWTEASQSYSKIFKLDKGGTYYLQFFVETASTGLGTLRINVNSGLLLTRYFVIGLIVCVIPLLIAWVKKGSA